MNKIYQIELHRKAKKELSKIPSKYKAEISLALVRLSISPYSGKPLDGRYKGYFSLKLWPYRIIYEIIHDQVIIFVIKIGHRKDIYK